MVFSNLAPILLCAGSIWPKFTSVYSLQAAQFMPLLAGIIIYIDGLQFGFFALTCYFARHHGGELAVTSVT